MPQENRPTLFNQWCGFEIWLLDAQKGVPYNQNLPVGTRFCASAIGRGGPRPYTKMYFVGVSALPDPQAQDDPHHWLFTLARCRAEDIREIAQQRHFAIEVVRVDIECGDDH